MSKYSEHLKSRKLNDLKYFFGENVSVSNDAKSILSFSHFKNENEIIIITNNIKMFKENYVLVVDNNKVVYLKDWQVVAVKNWSLQLNSYAVKLNRNFFKPYTLSFELDDMCIDQEITFDELVNVAMEQDNSNISWKLGHYECL